MVAAVAGAVAEELMSDDCPDPLTHVTPLPVDRSGVPP
jgi:hypothetical protein